MADRVRAIHRVLGVGSPAVVLRHPDGSIEVLNVRPPGDAAVDAALLELTKGERKRAATEEKRRQVERPFLVPITGGPPVHVDVSDRDRIDDIFGAAIEAQDDPTGTFTVIAADDQEHTLTARQVVFLATRLRQRLFAYNRRQAALSRNIDAAATVEEAEAVDIDAGWPD